MCSLHGIEIFCQTENGFWLNSNGWKTATTKRHMNKALKAHGINARVYQVRFKWWIEINGTTFEYKDNYEYQSDVLI